MAVFNYDDASLYYEIHGRGVPVLLLAPGGLHSTISAWHGKPINPIESLAKHFQVIAMDQRNAGQSQAKVSADHGWHTYVNDQLKLLDHLDISRCHVVGMCIGCSYSFGLINTQPQRIISAVMFQPIGCVGNNRDKFTEMFAGWQHDIAQQHPEASAADWKAFCNNMFGSDKDFVFSVSEAMVQQCPKPLQVLCGNDDYHPQATSRRIVELAPDVQFIEHWKGENSDSASAQILSFLQQHS